MPNCWPRVPHKIVFHRFLVLFLATFLAFATSVAAQTPAENIDTQVISRIREMALNHSEIKDTVEYLSDVCGPRLTGSPNLKRAQEYAKGKLAEWGLANAHLEPWGPFGRGWSLEGFTANVLAPTFSPLIAIPKAWSPGTNGTIRGEPIFLDVNATADLEKYRGKLRGKIVLFAPERRVEPLFEKQKERQSDADLLALANAPAPVPGVPFQFTPDQRVAETLNFAKWQLVQSEGAAVILQPAYRDGGTVYVTAATVPQPPEVPFEQRPHAYDTAPHGILPQAVVSAEQYNRLVRLISHGVPVQLEINIAVHFYDGDAMSANVIGEIPGTDLKDQIVMIGGSLDSWHAGTGATDNAVGAATAMEAVRIIQELGLRPRRTIRIGLWSAEEQGTLGSHAYVAAHFGRKIPTPPGSSAAARFEFQPEYEKLAGYFNLDYGTGRIRGVYLQGNEAVRPIFRAWLAPFNDLGASTLSLANIGATDHIPFDEIGLPAFQFLRDYVEGGPGKEAAHTNMDLFDHILEDDLKQSAAVAASFIYNLAMRDAPLPRKHADVLK